MKGDYYRYLAEVATGDTRNSTLSSCLFPALACVVCRLVVMNGRWTEVSTWMQVDCNDCLVCQFSIELQSTSAVWLLLLVRDIRVLPGVAFNNSGKWCGAVIAECTIDFCSTWMSLRRLQVLFRDGKRAGKENSNGWRELAGSSLAVLARQAVEAKRPGSWKQQLQSPFACFQWRLPFHN